MTAMRLGLICLLSGLLAGCTGFSLVSAGPTTVNSTLRVEPAIAWNRLTDGDVEMWTVDGLAVNELIFITSVKDGESLFRAVGEQKMPKFRKGMSALEIADLIQASLAVKQYSDVKIHALRPFKLGGMDGFRFDYSYTRRNGLEMKGMAVGAVRADSLNLILYSGARIHFFGQYRDEAEHIISTAKFI